MRRPCAAHAAPTRRRSRAHSATGQAFDCERFFRLAGFVRVIGANSLVQIPSQPTRRLGSFPTRRVPRSDTSAGMDVRDGWVLGMTGVRSCRGSGCRIARDRILSYEFARRALGGTPVQRRNARVKCCGSLKPRAKARSAIGRSPASNSCSARLRNTPATTSR